MDMESAYSPPTALTVISGIFLVLGALSFLIVTVDIIWRKGWRSMMWIMIPAYPINAAYLGPLTLYVYYKYGRPSKPGPDADTTQSHCHGKKQEDLESGSEDAVQEPSPCHVRGAAVQKDAELEKLEDNKPGHCCGKSKGEEDSALPISGEPSSCHSSPPDAQPEVTTPHCHSNSAARPMLATVLVGVHHCGAGCVLGDLVGEWLVYGTNASINGQGIWVELLVDYAFALLFGIIFQYFSIAPMTGEYGPKSVWRAAKADILSLTSFEVGAFGWMIIYQVGIWGYKLEMTTWTYWWMMQVGMAFGFATAIPVNWFLLRKGIKEPCC